MTTVDERDIIAFLGTLTDGYRAQGRQKAFDLVPTARRFNDSVRHALTTPHKLQAS